VVAFWAILPHGPRGAAARSLRARWVSGLRLTVGCGSEPPRRRLEVPTSGGGAVAARSAPGWIAREMHDLCVAALGQL